MFPAPEVNVMQGPEVNGIQAQEINDIQGHQFNGIQAPEINDIQGHEVNDIHAPEINTNEAPVTNEQLENIVSQNTMHQMNLDISLSQLNFTEGNLVFNN